jgi:hypothetical protein
VERIKHLQPAYYFNGQFCGILKITIRKTTSHRLAMSSGLTNSRNRGFLHFNTAVTYAPFSFATMQITTYQASSGYRCAASAEPILRCQNYKRGLWNTISSSICAAAAITIHAASSKYWLNKPSTAHSVGCFAQI